MLHPLVVLLSGWIETRLILVLLENANIIGSGNCFGPVAPDNVLIVMEGRKEMFYLTTHSTHFIYGYMASHIW